MLLGGSARLVLARQRREKILVFALLLPGQEGVARQHAMAQGVEARQLRAASLNRKLSRFCHDQNLRFRLSPSVRARNRSTCTARESSASISAAKTWSFSRS